MTDIREEVRTSPKLRHRLLVETRRWDALINLGVTITVITVAVYGFWGLLLSAVIFALLALVSGAIWSRTDNES